MKKLILLICLIWPLACKADVLPFIQKMFSELPDNYAIVVKYVTGKEETIEIASHNLNKELGIFEFVTKDDIWSWIPISSIQRLEFDKRFSKIMAIKEEEEKKKESQTVKSP
ncbi:MAG: hypothetical protein HYT75_04475 [Deltaproteobacteria bacterium]|nr:hypothetical protein [Deltaproteobacteria bacterium]